MTIAQSKSRQPLRSTASSLSGEDRNVWKLACCRFPIAANRYTATLWGVATRNAILAY